MTSPSSNSLRQRTNGTPSVCFLPVGKLDIGFRGIRMNAHTVRNYARVVCLGSKYVYQAIPRMLTLWLDLAENPKAVTHNIFPKIHSAICQAVEGVPAYKAGPLFTDPTPLLNLVAVVHSVPSNRV